MINKYTFADIKLLLLILLLPFIGACTQDNEYKSIKDKQIKLELQADAHYDSDLPENTVDSELKIDNVIALVFDQENSFAYRAEASTPTFNKESGKYEVNISLIESENGEKYSISLITNIKDIYGNLQLMRGKDKTDVLSTFTFDSALSGTQEYPLADSNISMPMYGETEYVEINANLNFPKAIPLMRAIVKVDIFFDVKDMDIKTGQSFENGNAVNFNLNSIHLHNAVKKGRVVPNLDNSKPWSSFIPSAPSLYLINSKPIFNPLFKYTDYDSKKNTLSRPVFIQENKGGNKDEEDLTVFIVGLTQEKNSITRYYRVDIIDAGTSDQLSHLIRNKYYKIHIKDVNGEGSSTPEEAIVSKDKCSASLEVTPWVVKSYSKKLYGTEYFDVTKRTVTFESKGVQDLPFKTNLGQVSLTWSDDGASAVKRQKITTEYYTVEVIKELNSGGGKIRIEALKETKSRFDEKGNTFHIHAGNMIVPIDIDQEKSFVNVPLESFDGKLVTKGYFSKDKELSPVNNSLMLELDASAYLTGLKDPEKANETFTMNVELGVGDIITVKSLNNTTGVKVELKEYMLKYQDFKFMHREDGTWEKQILLNIPITGKPKQMGVNTISCELQIYYKGGVLNFKSKVGEKLEDNKLNFMVYSVAPLSIVPPKMLIIGDSYYFDVNLDYSVIDKDLNVNLGRLLFNEKNFGLETDSKVKVEPFVYEYANKKHIKNIRHVPSFRSIINPSELEKYNIIIFLDSKEPNELHNAESAYVKKLVQLIKDKKIIFIQTPTYAERQSKTATSIRETFFTALTGSNNIVVQQSLDIRQISSKVDMQDLFTSNKTIPVYYPSRDAESIIKLMNPSANFRDYTYIVSGVYPNSKGLATVNRTSKNTIALMALNYYHLWFGSSFLFEDRAVGVDKDNNPKELNVKTYEGISQQQNNVRTQNSEFFLQVMKWAFMNLNNLN